MAGKYSSGKEKSRTVGKQNSQAEPLNHEQENIRKWLKQVRFKRTAFGGVNEADVWKKIAELNSLYEAALSAERARYDALLAQNRGIPGQGKAGGDGYG